jgi:peptide/nickel transport system permease protein
MAQAAQPLAVPRVIAVVRARGRGRAARHGALVAGALFVGVWALVAALAPWVAPHSPLDLDVMNRLQPPSWQHPFGTDEAGRDNFSRVLYGARITIPIAFTVVLVASVAGAAIGAVAGYVGGRIDEVLMRIVDVVLAFPSIVLAMAITAALGAGLRNAMLAILLVSWPEFSRLMRGQVLAVRSNEYVTAARALGVPAHRVLVAHVLPNAFPPIVVKGTLDIGNAIILTAAPVVHRAGRHSPRPGVGGDDRGGAEQVRVLVGGHVPGIGDPVRGSGLQLPRRRAARPAEPAAPPRPHAQRTI